MDIEKTLLPENGKLIKDNETASAKILDAELDILNCSFNNDLCVEIETEGYGYITLTLENLENLKRLIIEAEEYYEKYFNTNHD